MSSKSAGYCYPHISGGDALLLLCEAELGDPMQQLKDADYDAGDHALQRGVHSTLGLGMTGPAGWKDAGCVHESLNGVMMVCLLRPLLFSRTQNSCLLLQLRDSLESKQNPEGTLPGVLPLIVSLSQTPPHSSQDPQESTDFVSNTTNTSATMSRKYAYGTSYALR